jgi:hypothetical protein
VRGFWSSFHFPARANPGKTATRRRLTEQRASSDGKFSFLPHSAFAQTNAAGVNAITIADVAERALPAVVSVASTRVSRAQMPELPFDHPFLGDFSGRGARFRFRTQVGRSPNNAASGLA